MDRMLCRRLLPAPTCAVLLTLLTGCSGGDKPAASPTQRVTRSPAVTKVVVAPGTAKGFAGARSDVMGLHCARAGAAWTVTGVVYNRTATVADYRIYTSFLSKDHDTRGLLQTDVNGVAPKKKRSWSGRLALREDGLTCVLRVERTPRHS